MTTIDNEDHMHDQILHMGPIVDDTDQSKVIEDVGAPPTNFKLYFSSVGLDDELIFN